MRHLAWGAGASGGWGDATNQGCALATPRRCVPCHCYAHAQAAPSAAGDGGDASGVAVENARHPRSASSASHSKTALSVHCRRLHPRLHAHSSPPLPQAVYILDICGCYWCHPQRHESPDSHASSRPHPQGVGGHTCPLNPHRRHLAAGQNSCASHPQSLSHCQPCCWCSLKQGEPCHWFQGPLPLCSTVVPTYWRTGPPTQAARCEIHTAPLGHGQAPGLCQRP
mmetsp:Transcript_18402/g.51584  ORF Transcript_18402/g.51584 Transcript_18402/m.51584 type:complete len:225 (-) Transcript_18402:2661-3335(-)